MLRFTPCDHPGDAVNYSSIDACAARCLSSCDVSSDCTTAVIKTKMGDGRACNDGKLGLDDVGGCVPAFGDLKDAWDYFDGSCTACSDSDACWSACNTVMKKAPAVVDSAKTHPSVCPSFDCPDCVGPCGNCDSTGCMNWCNDFYQPEVHCTGDTAKSVQGTFTDYSLDTRTTDAEKAIGTFYDAQCKNDNAQRNQQYFDAFGNGRYRANLRNRYEAQSRQTYVSQRVREAEERRAQQLAAMGISSTLRSRSRSSRRTRANAAEMATCRNGFGQVMQANDNGECEIIDDPVPTTGLTSATGLTSTTGLVSGHAAAKKKEDVTVLSLLKQLFDKLNPKKPKSTKLVAVQKKPAHREPVARKAQAAVRLTQHQARLTNAAKRRRLLKQATQPPKMRNLRKQKAHHCQQTNQGATMCRLKQ